MSKFGHSNSNAHKTSRDVLLASNASMKVLVVDYKKELLAYVSKVLHSCSFEVTCVDHSVAALRLLSEKNNQFDLLLIDSDMSDVDTHTFLRSTKNMDLLPVVMSEEEDISFIQEVFKSGAFLVVKRPLTIDAVWHIRQDIIRKRMHAHERCKHKNMIIKNETQETEIRENRSCGTRKNGRCEPKKRVHQATNDDDDSDDDINVKKKLCVEWTEELHDKFVDALRQLGEGRCSPKNVLNLMGVPDLTTKQVASHLQKYRKEKLNSNEKKTKQNHTQLPSLLPQGYKERKVGRMPSLQRNQKDHGGSNITIDINQSINESQTKVDHIKNQIYGGSSMLNISKQENFAQQIDQYTQIPTGSDQEFNQDDGFGRSITKRTNNNFQQTISGLRDAAQCSKDQNLSTSRRQGSEEFPNFLEDMDGNGPTDM